MNFAYGIVALLTLFSLDSFSNQSEQPAHSLYECAQALQSQGKIPDAIRTYQQVLAYLPDHFEAHFYLGNLFFYQKNYHEALYHYQKATHINNKSAHAYHNLGISHKMLGNTPSALEAFNHEATLNPSNTTSHLQLAQLYHKEGHKKDAITHYETVCNQEPTNATAAHELGLLLKEEEQFNRAIMYLSRAAASQPNNSGYHFDLANTLLQVGRISESIEEFKHVLRLNPQARSAEYNIGYALKTAGNLDDALAIYESLIEAYPDHESARLARSFAYLMKGDFVNGWKAHTWYLKKSHKNADELRLLLQQNQLAGHTILLVPEGGLGDSIHFIRYAQRLKEYGSHVIVSIQKELYPLISRCPYIDQIITSGSNVPPFHARSTLMSLPAVFEDTEDTMPRNIPYIFPDPDLIHSWKERLQRDTNFKVGICWQASVFNDSSRMPIARRGIPLSQFFCLKDIPGVTFYSLQKKEGLEQLDIIPVDFNLKILDRMYDFDEEHGPFMDTAAAMESLDLIITIDSATAHLAGALGRPVWLLLPYSQDWRWIVGRNDSPWYPTMRIFKQPKPFDWNSPMQQIYQELKQVVENYLNQ